MSPTRWRLYISLKTAPRINSLLGKESEMELKELMDLMELMDEVVDVHVEYEVA